MAAEPAEQGRMAAEPAEQAEQAAMARWIAMPEDELSAELNALRCGLRLPAPSGAGPLTWELACGVQHACWLVMQSVHGRLHGPGRKRPDELEPRRASARAPAEQPLQLSAAYAHALAMQLPAAGLLEWVEWTATKEEEAGSDAGESSVCESAFLLRYLSG
jgi:hypothetical protein